MTWIEWYDSLIKPSWTPEPATMGLVWQILYAVIFITFAVNLVANLAFTPIQFGLRSLFLAAADILVVWGTILWMMIAIWNYCKWVALAQVPYFARVSIATPLQLSISWNKWSR